MEEKSQKIYDSIINQTAKIDNSTPLKQFLTAQVYMKQTSNVSFEELVWIACKPDKDLANEIMRIAEMKLNETKS